MRQGMFLDNAVFPYILGWDAAGVVEAVGKSVKRFKKGDRVYCAGNVSGGYAEYVVSEERQTGHLGDKLTFAQGASVGVPYYTAYNAIVFKAHAKKGETVLIHGASGAVGLAAVQQCKSMGLRVLGTAGTPKGLDLVKRCGAEAVFNHREKGYAEKIKEATKTSGLNIILEMNGGLNLQLDLELISLRGRIAVIGTRQEATINPELFLAKEPIVLGVSLPHSTKEEWEEMTAAIEAGIKSGWVQPVVAREYPLAEAKQAQLDIMDSSMGASGNLVLKI
ncbi:quinone oxidoreductase-like [Pomacea canaliculata]|nr:quinone oxidoreductase-like [Pomacea canaliculata]